MPCVRREAFGQRGACTRGAGATARHLEMWDATCGHGPVMRAGSTKRLEPLHPTGVESAGKEGHRPLGEVALCEVMSREGHRPLGEVVPREVMRVSVSDTTEPQLASWGGRGHMWARCYSTRKIEPGG